jgi:hypothetical protein
LGDDSEQDEASTNTVLQIIEEENMDQPVD